MKRSSLSLLVLLAAQIGCRRDVGPPPIERSTLARDPIVAVGHGAIVGLDGRAVDPAPAFAIEAQRYYLARLYRQASARDRAAFDARRRGLRERAPRTEAERIVTNAALIAWLNDAVQPRDAADVASKNMALLARFARIDPDRVTAVNPQAGELGPSVAARLRAQGMLTFALSTQSGGQAYVDECARAGVPIPPDWGSSQWQSRGLLTVDFLGSTPEAEVFVYESESPRGVCMALPRSNGDTIGLLGIICLGTKSARSCFWDNQRNKQQFDIGKGDTVALSDFAGGADLYGGTGGTCTDCHAGENPYVVHPGQPMDLGTKIRPAKWSEPLVHPAWPQNAGPTTVLQGIQLGAGEKSCLACHQSGTRFPDVSTQTPGYCGVVLPTALSRTMPSTSPGNTAAYTKHVDALTAACNRPPAGGVVINGATQSTPTSDRSDTSGDLGTCTAGTPDCPIGFCYWRTLHGPFWQTTPPTVAPEDPAYRGSFVRIFAEAGKWKWRAFSDGGGTATAPPGGTAECLSFDQIVGVPDPTQCFSSGRSVLDPDGTHGLQTVDATVNGPLSANVLAGYIGNVAQYVDPPDYLRIFERSGGIHLEQKHTVNPPGGLKVGPLQGESWTNTCAGWTPVFEAEDIRSTSDVQLVPSAQADKARCYITGVGGGWSATRNGGATQPFAEIYRGASGDVRLRVDPIDGFDQVEAWASCIRIK